MSSCDPENVSPTLSSPQRWGYLTQEPPAQTQSVLHTMLWRGAQSLLPLPGLGQNTPGKVKAPFSICLCGVGRSWESPLPWDTPYMCTSSYLIVCQHLWDKSIATLAWPSLLSSWEKQSLAGLCTPSKNPKWYLCCHGILQERIGAVQVPALLLPVLVWSTHKNSAESLLPEGSTGDTVGFNQKCFQGKP